MKVINTLSTDVAQNLAQHIDCVNFPALQIIPDDTWQLPDLGKFNKIIFTSINAVHNFFTCTINLAPETEIFAIGAHTRQALAAYTIHHCSVPFPANSENLLALPALHQVENEEILIIKGHGGRTLISTTLTARKAKVTKLSVYRRAMPNYSPDKIMRTVQNNSKIITFFSEQSINNIFTIFGSRHYAWLTGLTGVVISDRLAAIARDKGMKTVVSCNTDNIIHTICTLLTGE